MFFHYFEYLFHLFLAIRGEGVLFYEITRILELLQKIARSAAYPFADVLKVGRLVKLADDGRSELEFNVRAHKKLDTLYYVVCKSVASADGRIFAYRGFDVHSHVINESFVNK